MSRLVCLGMVVKDIVFRVPQIPPTPQKLTASSLRSQFGGMAATAAATAAALGGEVEFWGRIGDDEAGREAVRAFRRRGVEPRLQATAGSQSPLSAVIVDDAGERMLAVYTGQLDPAADWLPLERLQGAGAVHADFRWVEGARALYEAAHSQGIPRVLDADAGNAEGLTALIGLADHIIFSERGLADYAGGMPIEQALLQVAQERAIVVGVTLGDQGSLFCHEGQIHAFAASRITAKDTNGAGDVFHGAYALALARGQSWVQAVAYASATASLKCTRDHGWDLLPQHNEVMAFMHDHL
jgi:sulfofructose kinase